MGLKNAHELRNSARHYREMSDLGGDLELQAALLQLADEFDLEAAKLEAITGDFGDEPERT